ncbi:lysophosphatidic acid phosphatase type 6 [Anaeramoeba flamelloides]|uniref:Lysophosphatidic acid phosphatase type 6 n=1 Tax=Anaeramoeba flamelloides TaxID=1746091 RepID=A0ABQ8XSN7_9EUKA|nr:lysophosphatidic acid phosphatase type 6 [Anaeramoeba flamelloides]
MKVLLLTLILVFCFTQVSTEKKLVLFQTFTRHGARTPIYYIKGTDALWLCTNMFNEIPSINNKGTSQTIPYIFQKQFQMDGGQYKGNCTSGMLTTQGASEHRALGHYFHETLVDTGFLSDKYDPNEIFIRACDDGRIRQSAESLFTGLYGDYVQESELKEGASNTAQVVPVHVMETSLEYLNPNTKLCPHLGTLITKRHSTKEWKDYHDGLKDLEQKMVDIFGTEDLPPLGHIYDTLEAREAHDVPFPEGLTSDIYQQLSEVMFWEWNYTNSDLEISVLSLGLGMRDILQQMVLKINSLSDLKFIHYSGHDSTVSPIMYMLGFQIGQPPYASHTDIQLYKETDQYYVKVSYLKKDKILPWCGELYCPFETFYKYMMDILPVSYYQTCHP